MLFCSAGSHRSIPAWAGETAHGVRQLDERPVYPRVGGGNSTQLHVMPRMMGLSPRGRGKPPTACEWMRAARSIPAWAGETRLARRAFAAARVYPRVGGGNQFNKPWVASIGGLSPRGRGKLEGLLPDCVKHRSIPAWAGETYSPFSPRIARKVYPRVGGGNARPASAAAAAMGLSPRGRGKPPPGDASVESARSIPAWAGETRTSRLRRRRAPVYPRVGGGNLRGAIFGFWAIGLSPRGRGKPCRRTTLAAARRSIPAWAGETLLPAHKLRWREVYPRVGGGNRNSIALPPNAVGLSPRGRGKPKSRPC